MAAFTASASLFAYDRGFAASGSSAQADSFVYQPVPVLSVEGETIEVDSMSAYAEQLGVPAVAFAVYKNGELFHEEFRGEGIGPDSLFQGASLAKSVSSATIATLAEQKGISLDEDVSKYITSFDLTSLEGYQAPVTLRELLSHTSQANVSGFPGYPQSADIPSNLEVILGSEKSKTDRVAFTQPEGKWFYSGGGYQIAQAFAEDVSGKPFAQLAQELIMEPLGMQHTMFRAALDANAVAPLIPVPGNENKGPVEGGWYNYPELATAGLWTTTSDFAKFVNAIMAAADGDENAGISPQVAKDMLTVSGQANPFRGYGLGIGIVTNDDGEIESFEHTGKNVGYRVGFSAYPKERALSIMLTNHPKGLQLSAESNRGFGMSLGYVDPAARTITPVPLTDDLRMQCLGKYAADNESKWPAELLEQDGKVIFRDEDADYPLVPIGKGLFAYIPLAITFKCEVSGGQTILSYSSSNRFIKQ